jgi:hypothetical protein
MDGLYNELTSAVGVNFARSTILSTTVGGLLAPPISSAGLGSRVAFEEPEVIIASPRINVHARLASHE